MYHEEMESLSKHLPEIKRMRFWMTFGEQYLTHLRVLENVGMTRIDPVMHNGVEIIPLQFLKSVLPNPGDLGKTTKGPHLYWLRGRRGKRRCPEKLLHL
jgi:saccharopine dehydrogenase (NAD+, L-lysine-forming)